MGENKVYDQNTWEVRNKYMPIRINAQQSEWIPGWHISVSFGWILVLVKAKENPTCFWCEILHTTQQVQQNQVCRYFGIKVKIKYAEKIVKYKIHAQKYTHPIEPQDSAPAFLGSEAKRGTQRTCKQVPYPIPRTQRKM